MSPQDIKVDYAALKGLSREEISAQISSGGLVVPPANTPERKAFLEFAKMDDETREQFISDRAEEQPGTPPETPAPKDELPGTTPAPEVPVGTTPAPSSESTPSTEPQDEPWWKKRGYDSEDEGLTAIDSLRDETENLQSQVNRRNADDGKVGRENKELRERLEKLENDGTPLPGGEPTAVELPTEIPKPPSLSDFDDNPLDDDYVAAQVKYGVEMQEYSGKLLAFNQSVVKKLADVEGRVDQVAVDASEGKSARATTAAQTKWNDLWGDMRNAQKELGLETTVDIAKINKAVADGNNAVIKSLPKADLTAYNAIRKIAYAYADFGEDGKSAPTPRYKTVKAAMVDNGIEVSAAAPNPDELTPAEEKAARDAKNAEKDGTVAVPSATHSDGGDTPTDGLSDEEAGTRLMSLNDQRSKNPAAFAGNAQLMEEFNRLRVRFGAKPVSATSRR